MQVAAGSVDLIPWLLEPNRISDPTPAAGVAGSFSRRCKEGSKMLEIPVEVSFFSLCNSDAVHRPGADLMS
jgi:hypothetical protein